MREVVVQNTTSETEGQEAVRLEMIAASEHVFKVIAGVYNILDSKESL